MAQSYRKVATIDGRGHIQVIEEPIPQPNTGQVLIEVKASMISPGSELGGVKHRRSQPTDAKPKPFGYSNAGVVIDRGEGCDDIVLGTRVACMGAGYAQHTTHACVPRNMAITIPQNVTDEAASSIHLAATGLHAARRAQLQLGEHVAVVGLGLVGQFVCQWSRLAGAKVMAIDRLNLRLAAATATGAHQTVNKTELDPVTLGPGFTRGYGFDAGVIAFGGDATEAFKMLLRMMKQAPDTHNMGRIVIVGSAWIKHLFAAGAGNVDVRSAARTGPGYHDEAWEHGADYPPVFLPWTTKRNLEECLLFMASGDLNVDALITHRASLDEAPQLCDLLIEQPQAALGVVLIP